jgi:hypothetical protein
MLIRLTRRLARRYRRAEVTLVRWNTAKPLRRRLSRTSDQALDRALSAARMDRGDLFTPFKGNAKHRKRMAAMMARFRLDRTRACESFWPELREAENVCADCSKVRRCVRLQKWGLRRDAARLFCPNAALFDKIAAAGRGRQMGDTESGPLAC